MYEAADDLYIWQGEVYAEIELKSICIDDDIATVITKLKEVME